MDDIVFNPPSLAIPSSARGVVYNLMGTAGTARTPISTQFQLPQSGTVSQELTGSGGEGIVVKPAANLTRGSKGLVQPGLKVRGREYLRIIYGPDYTEEANLDRLRQRGLGHKRSMAQRELKKYVAR